MNIHYDSYVSELSCVDHKYRNMQLKFDKPISGNLLLLVLMLDTYPFYIGTGVVKPQKKQIETLWALIDLYIYRCWP